MNILIFENKLKSKISNSIKELYDLDIEVELEKPNDLQNGNFSTNIALKLTKELKLNPLEIATSIKDNLSVCDKFERVEVAKPGFINFYMSNNFYSLILESIDNEFGTLDANDDKYLVEYVSANPTGDLHLGHARGAVYGDSLIKIMKTAGYNVDSEYYLNDFGSQMNNLGES
ncbi:MAG: arginine--tRNA ligase, partial [Mycoplasmatales bacterium]